MKTQIQIQFPSPGVWDKLNITAVYRDAEGYTHTDAYTQEDIPADQAPALAAAVTAIVSMGEDWQAVQVWATLDTILLPPDPLGPKDSPLATMEAVILIVEAVNDQGGRRMFTTSDYPEFTITDPAAVAFFKHFTNQ